MYEYYSIISHLFIFSDLMAWVNSMQASLSSQELASNVSGAERLLNKHKVREREGGRKDTITCTYCTAGNFGGTKFRSVVNFNLANLWPCAIEHAHNGVLWWYKIEGFIWRIAIKC